ncbi:MAG: hypothetical protein P8184_17845 [Calditrichia bacterium]
MNKRLIIFSLPFLFPLLLLAQFRNYQLNLTKDNISWYWEGNLNLNYQTGLQNRFFFENRFTSNLFRQRYDEKKWKDENNLQTWWEHRFNDYYATSTRLRSHIFSDQNSFVKFSKHLFLQQFSYFPVPNVKLTPGAGWASEDIYSYRDQGWYTELNLDVDHYDIGGYVNSTNTHSAYYFFPGRKNQEHKYYVAFNRQFSKIASDSIRVGYEYLSNSYHLAQGDFLENVEVNARFLYNELNYITSDRSALKIETRLQNRDVSQSNPSLLNHRRELTFANRIGWRYAGPKFESGIDLVNSQVTNLSSRLPGMGSESRNDVEGLQAALNLFTNWRISPSDEARLTFSYTKYEYSSPDTTQTIDEDDLRFITDLRYIHIFSPYFALKLNFNMYLYHQIYIHASRSANNNWNRILQLAPSFRFTIPGVLEHTNQIKILANYTIYDFEEILPQARSYIYRKLIYSDSLSLRLSDGLRLVTIYQLEKEDNGTFFKDIFAQQVSRELRSHFIDLSLVYLRIRNLKFVTGLNWYLRKEWGFAPVRRVARDYRAFSPRISVLYNIGSRILLHLTFAPKTYKDMDSPRVNYATGQVNLRYLF